MVRHKQPAPQRRRGLTLEAEPSVVEQRQQEVQQPHLILPGQLPRPDAKHELRSELQVPVNSHSNAALAELLVATKAAAAPPADVAPLQACVQLFEKRCGPWLPDVKHTLLISWHCPGEDKAGPKHEVCCQLPDKLGDAVLALLRQGHLAVSIHQCREANQQQQAESQQPLALQRLKLPPQQQHETQQQHASGSIEAEQLLLQPVQFTTMEVDSCYVEDFKCDVIMLPRWGDIHAAMDRCCTLAAAAASAAGGPVAGLACQDKCLLEALAPRLPAQHVSLMAAAAAPQLLQQAKQQQQQQEQAHKQQQPDAAGMAAAAVAGNSEGAAVSATLAAAPAAAAALTLWQLRLCLTDAAIAAYTATDAEQKHPAQWGCDSRHLHALMTWLVPHWLNRPRMAYSVHSAVFDPAEVYSATKPTGLEPQLQGKPHGLKPQLRPYQRRAVAWMLEREAGPSAMPTATKTAAAAAETAAAAPTEATAGMSRAPAGHKSEDARKSGGACREEGYCALAGSATTGMLAGLLALKLHSDWRTGLLLPPLLERGVCMQHASSSCSSLHVVVPPAAGNKPLVTGSGGGKSSSSMSTGTGTCSYPAGSNSDSSCGDGSISAQVSPASSDSVGPDQAAAAACCVGASLQQLHKLYFKPGSPCGSTLFSLDAFLEPPCVAGGILADEMGLGKTVELLSVVMGNRFKPVKAEPQQQQQQDPYVPGGDTSLGPQPFASRKSCCSRCGEHLGPHYTKDGLQSERRSAVDAEDDIAPLEGCDTDDYMPGKSSNSRKRGRQQRQQQHQVAHGAGHHGAKRPRKNRAAAAADEEESSGLVGTSAAAALQESAGSGDQSCAGVLCTLCMRQIALQEVDQECGTTLIVVPSNILVQWVDELQHHITPGSLSIKVYSGQPQDAITARSAAARSNNSSKSRSRSSTPGKGKSVRDAAAAAAAGASRSAARQEVVTAVQLAAADIVLTTYDVMRRELAFQPQTQGAPERSLRHRKRYAVVPTPLSRLGFWRLVLDEAQLAGGATKVAEMAQHVKARHRWAITGTPISHGGASDLTGLLKYLQVPNIPANVERNSISRGRLLRLLCPMAGGLMWRTAKADVLAEMGLPPQHHHTTLLRLSAIERHWYNRGHQECAAKARKVLQDALEDSILGHSSRRNTGNEEVAAARAAAAKAAAAAIAAGGDGRQLDAASAAVLGPLLDHELSPAQQKKLLLPLLRLRQACCHPQVGAGGLRGVMAGSNSSKPLTMDQILSVLVSRARVEAEEAQRQLIGALNGLAALMRLSNLAPDAVKAYREVLALSEANKGEVRVDPLQLLHTLHNLSELLAELARKQQQGQQKQQQPAVAAAEGSAAYGPNVPQTLRDASLASEAAAIKDQYLAQRQAELHTAHKAFKKLAKDALPAGLHTRKRRQQEQQAHEQQPCKKAAVPVTAAAANVEAGAGTSSYQRAMMLDDATLSSDDGLDGDDGVDVDGDEGPSTGWYVSIIDALIASGRDEELAELIRTKLQESDTYARKVSKNATSMANRFSSLHGLKLLLSQELSAISHHQAVSLHQLHQLHEAVASPDGPNELLIEQAGQCGRCRAGMGVTGRVCKHCKLDEEMRTWEARLFQLQTRALAAGMQVDASEAARQAQAAAIRRVVGRGGLNEAAAEDQQEQLWAAAAAAAAGSDPEGGVVLGPSAGAGARRADAAVSDTQVVRHPSEAERVLRMLQQQVSRLGLTSSLPGVSEAASKHLEQLEGSRKMFVAVNSVITAQRQLLYAHDELAMAVQRITSRREGEQVSAHEALFKLTAAEQVVKNAELSLEKTLAAGELNRALGTLRYLKTIASTRRRAAAAAGPTGVAAAAAAAEITAAGGPSSQQLPAEAAAGVLGTSGNSGAGQKPADARAAAAAAALQRAAAAAAAGADDARNATPPSSAAAAADDAGGCCGGSCDKEAALSHHQEQQQQEEAQQEQCSNPAAAAGVATSGDQDPIAADEHCPICHDPVEKAAAVLPCGHVLCCSCADTLAARIPAATPHAHRRINCPTCRGRHHVSDVAYVDSGQGSKHVYVRTDSTMVAAGAAATGAATGTATGAATAASRTGVEAAEAAAATGAATAATHAGDEAAEADADADADCPFAGEQQLVLAGSYGTKVEAVVRRVLFLLQQDPSCKVLVFSSWADVLSIVSHALTDNGVHHALGKGRKGLLQALEQFKGCKVSEEEALGQAADADATDAAEEEGAGAIQEEPEARQDQQQLGPDGADMDVPKGSKNGGKEAATSASVAEAGHRQQEVAAGGGVRQGPRVLLLLVSQGGLGLNLVEAQHVVLLEPLLDPAMDVQAIGRVSRFGQTRVTHVHRFIVQHTVEENVARLSHERAAAMDMTAAVPTKGGTGGSGEVAKLTVREVAALLCSKWRDVGGMSSREAPAEDP